MADRFAFPASGGFASEPGWVYNPAVAACDVDVDLPPLDPIPPWTFEVDGVHTVWVAPHVAKVTEVGLQWLTWWGRRN